MKKYSFIKAFFVLIVTVCLFTAVCSAEAVDNSYLGDTEIVAHIDTQPATDSQVSTSPEGKADSSDGALILTGQQSVLIFVAVSTSVTAIAVIVFVFKRKRRS